MAPNNLIRGCCCDWFKVRVGGGWGIFFFLVELLVNFTYIIYLRVDNFE
jgi:hypothetical protein